VPPVIGKIRRKPSGVHAISIGAPTLPVRVKRNSDRSGIIARFLSLRKLGWSGATPRISPLGARFRVQSRGRRRGKGFGRASYRVDQTRAFRPQAIGSRRGLHLPCPRGDAPPLEAMNVLEQADLAFESIKTFLRDAGLSRLPHFCRSFVQYNAARSSERKLTDQLVSVLYGASSVRR
jgi:hypothetical protein